MTETVTYESLVGGILCEVVEYHEPGTMIDRSAKFDFHLHRKDGPAVIAKSKDTGEIIKQEWYLHGRHHRDDGPAIQTDTGHHSWCVYGRVCISFDEWVDLSKCPKDKAVLLKLKYC